MFTPDAAVRPLSPPATRLPPEISIVVPDCTASAPALTVTLPLSMRTLPFVDLIPSLVASTVTTEVPLISTDVLPFMPFVLLPDVELSVVTETSALLILRSLLQTIPS